MDEEYWGVGIPGLTEDGARQLLSSARALGWDGYEVDPAIWYARHLDRVSVEIRMKLMAAGLASLGDSLTDQERWGGQSAIEDMQEWLEQAAEVSND